MNKEELKKKIIEVLEETEYEWTEQKNGYILQIFYDKLADALIEAGIGDVQSLVDGTCVLCVKDKGIMRLYNEQEINEMIHRKEVAERALLLACANVVKDEKDDVDMELLVLVVYDKYLKQAEKELAEEGKGGKNE